MNRFDEDDLDRTLEGLRAERPPFTESDYASMRRAVWRQVEARPRGLGFAWGWRLGAGALAASALLVALLVGRSQRPDPAARLATATRPPQALQPGSPEDVPPLPLVVRSPAPAPARRPHPALARVRGAAPVQIEFQTANPDIRIIWLVKPGEAPPRRSARAETEEVS